MTSKLITAKALREIVPVTDMTFWRWEQSETLGFPKPIRIQKRRYWREDEVLAWLEAQESAQEAAA